jgi:hypothetical protein
MSLHIHIGRLVLEGVELRPRDRETLRQALTGHLSSLFEASGFNSTLAGGAALDSLNGEAPTRASNAHELGLAIARRVHRGLSR